MQVIADQVRVVLGGKERCLTGQETFNNIENLITETQI